MNISRPFILRPVATTLLTVALTLSGAFAYTKLPVAPLPNVAFPVIQVQATQPGGSPEEVAETVATPLERHLGTIAGVTEMTSESVQNSTRIVIQFDLSTDVNTAAHAVEAAIQSARADLPTSLRSNPVYHKFNPAGQPIMILALTSKTKTMPELFDLATNVLQQQLSKVQGVGNFQPGGSSLPAVRVEMNPLPMFQQGIGFEDVRAALSSANANTPKGFIDVGPRRYQLDTNDQARKAADYRDLVVGYRNGAPIRLTDIAEINDSVEDLRNAGYYNGEPSVICIVYPQANANIIKTIDGIKALLPTLQTALPADVSLHIGMDRSTTIRASVSDTQTTLLIAIVLVVLVVLVFLRTFRSTLIPAVAVPVSIISTFSAMYMLGFALDNLSLMALTIATGFVVDDAIVVLENIARHMEDGMPRLQAALQGTAEVSFTVISITVSLIAVFMPILLLPGIAGKFFYEFAMTLIVTISVSLVLALTITPMMCSLLLVVQPRVSPEQAAEDTRRARSQAGPVRRAIARFSALIERGLDGMLHGYEKSLNWALRHRRLVVLTLPLTIVLTILLVQRMPKSFFPTEDNGLLIGRVEGEQSISFQNMQQKLIEVQNAVLADPDVLTVAGFTGGRGTNQAQVYIQLKDISQRSDSVEQTIGRLSASLKNMVGARFFAFSAGDVRAGARSSSSNYQYTLTSDDSELLYSWAQKIEAALKKRTELADVDSDVSQGGQAIQVAIDRDSAARLKLTPQLISNTLNDAFGQRSASVIYNTLNQYHVVMEVAPRFWQDPSILKQIWVSAASGTATGSASSNLIRVSNASSNASGGTTNGGGSGGQSISNTSATVQTGTGIASATSGTTSGTSSTTTLSTAQQSQQNANSNSLAGGKGASNGSAVSSARETMVPLSAVTTIGPTVTPLEVSHDGGFVAATISFNTPVGGSLSAAETAIGETMLQLHVPAEIHGAFAGNAQQLQQTTSSYPLVVLAALLAVYATLGILYESYIHPLTILSTLPSAGVGAILALQLFGEEFSLIAMIGVILLIGIVKKNAILLIDFALSQEREHGATPYDAIYQACLLRFRPIMMTSFAAALGALPLVLGHGYGNELRRPLGLSVVGGLIVSQALTLYTTPVVYLYLDRMRHWSARRWSNRSWLGGGRHPPRPGPTTQQDATAG
ncbi:nodulation protein [Lichenicola cladoniae]|uniref:Nodulation protein n=1 Tax=Lichenicola cladoniae TaxID=1484109 RepID=A0A6M8HME0_9PROT|nr:efflux RND transporter permease subunit [Lichenicola cladoniae]NPD67011.1 nodulation protein [Acetobacteraceae bacterium]QKE89559.1 nodulation protein [Lichenicola cladoniae]